MKNEEIFEKLLKVISKIDPDEVDRDAIESALKKELSGEELEQALKSLFVLMGGVTEVTENPDKYFIGDSSEKQEELDDSASTGDEKGR
jgi:hypothetical protein